MSLAHKIHEALSRARSEHKKGGGPSSKKKEHPGFKKVQSKIEHEGYSKKIAGAILAHATRGASKAAHKANPRLNRVKG